MLFPAVVEAMHRQSNAGLVLSAGGCPFERCDFWVLININGVEDQYTFFLCIRSIKVRVDWPVKEEQVRLGVPQDGGSMLINDEKLRQTARRHAQHFQIAVPRSIHSIGASEKETFTCGRFLPIKLVRNGVEQVLITCL